MVENFKYNREQQIKITTDKNSSTPLVGKRKSRSDSLDDWKKCKLINEVHFAEFQLLWNDIDDTVSSRTSNSSSTLSSIGNNSEEEDDDGIIPNQRSKNSNHSPLQSVLVNSFTAYVTHQNRFHELNETRQNRIRPILASSILTNRQNGSQTTRQNDTRQHCTFRNFFFH